MAAPVAFAGNAEEAMLVRSRSDVDQCLATIRQEIIDLRDRSAPLDIHDFWRLHAGPLLDAVSPEDYDEVLTRLTALGQQLEGRHGQLRQPTLETTHGS